MKLIVGNLNNGVAETLRRQANQRLKHTTEVTGDKQPAAFSRREKVIAVKNEVNNRLPNSYKMDVVHNGVPRILPENLTKIRLVVTQCLR